MSRRSVFSASGAVSLLLVLSVQFSMAQGRAGRMKTKPQMDSVLATLKLDNIEGQLPVFYSHGYAVRARAIQDLMVGCATYYEKEFPLTFFALKFYVLTKEDWIKAGFKSPYGLPFYSQSWGFMVIAADKNAMANLVDQPITGDSSDRVVSGYDYAALHELGHYFFATLEHTEESIKDHWYKEFLASYFMICYLKDKGLNKGLEQRTNKPGTAPYRSLPDFERLYPTLGMGAPNYDWYQRKFRQLAFRLYPDLKLNLIHQTLNNFAPGGPRLDPLAFLEKLKSEVVEEWLTGLK